MNTNLKKNLRKARKTTVERIVKLANAAGAEVKLSLTPSTPAGESIETTRAHNDRIVAQAMKAQKRLSLEDAQRLACGFTVNRATGKMRGQQMDELREGLGKLEADCAERSRLARELRKVSRDLKDQESCNASAVVWMRASNLVAALLEKHFPVNTEQVQPFNFADQG